MEPKRVLPPQSMSSSSSRSHSMSSAPRTRVNGANKQKQLTLINAQLRKHCEIMRRTADLPEPVRPVARPGERVSSTPNYYVGEKSITSPLDSQFYKLGMAFWGVYSITTGKHIRVHWDTRSIPLFMLQENKEVIDLLAARHVVKAKEEYHLLKSGSSLSRPATLTGLDHHTSSPAKSSSPAPFPLHLLGDESDDESDSRTANSDKEIEIVSVTPVDERVVPTRTHQNRKARYNQEWLARGDVSTSSSDFDEVEQLLVSKAALWSNISVVLWTKNDCMQQRVAKVSSASTFISLSMIANRLSSMGLSPGVDIERYISGKGWKKILWDTPFPIDERTLVALKLTGIEVTDWDVHVEHMFSH
ncbi:hypothetical protein F5890DRAFT_1559970 [Lentinula detonsa]|uniref:Uncharacterized protein n=1 Tax=Lentinula detonsa TaxID=2804962 RepID=A0AA38PNY8_9AGAR|nr:hypothetical protein F5890DRAFT_1559970 [Lentinula detonsa]